jgi:hypothetical protein
MINKLFLLIVVTLLSAASCRKPKTTVNNYLLPGNDPKPAFAVNGITDQTLTTDFLSEAAMNITVTYLDSAQENVTLSLSGLPANIVIDTGWVHSGIPTFGTILSIYDTSSTSGAQPGIYPVTMTATTSSGKQKFFKFNLRILPMPTSFLGKYTNCSSFCGPTVNYSDSVYLDATVPNKIWFANYAGSGHAVYGMMTGQGGNLTIPTQTVGGNTYSGSGSIFLPHSINISMSGSSALNLF